MTKNNNGLMPNFKTKDEGGQDKQKFYRKFSGKKNKISPQSDSGRQAQKNQANFSAVQKNNKKSNSAVSAAQKSTQRNIQKKTAPVKKAAAKPVQQIQQIQQRQNNFNQNGQNNRNIKTTPLKIYSLGGLNEIGKNIYVYDCANDIFIIDCGLAFPDEDMPGIDMVIPDFTYLEKNKHKIRGIVLTHGHEDHIGSIPYLLKKVNVPVYGTRLTLGLVEGKLREHGILASSKLITVSPGDTVKLGCMTAEFIRVNHSIPDACAIAVHTPAGVVVHTGDFKIDYTPIEGGIIDLARFGELGRKGVLALLSESTNAERPGYTMSERTVGNSFKNIFNQAEGRRIIVATFSSNIHRIQQIVDNAVLQGRKVAVSGRSMLNVMQKAIELNYIRIPEGMLIDIEQIRN